MIGKGRGGRKRWARERPPNQPRAFVTPKMRCSLHPARLMLGSARLRLVAERGVWVVIHAMGAVKASGRLGVGLCPFRREPMGNQVVGNDSAPRRRLAVTGCQYRRREPIRKEATRFPPRTAHHAMVPSRNCATMATPPRRRGLEARPSAERRGRVCAGSDPLASPRASFRLPPGRRLRIPGSLESGEVSR